MLWENTNCGAVAGLTVAYRTAHRLARWSSAISLRPSSKPGESSACTSSALASADCCQVRGKAFGVDAGNDDAPRIDQFAHPAAGAVGYAMTMGDMPRRFRYRNAIC
jgi:hypothetical protein